MNFFVAVTDYDWFQLHASKSRVDEVNFWRPSPEASFKALRTVKCCCSSFTRRAIL